MFPLKFVFVLSSIITVPQVIFFERRFLGILQIRIGLFIYFLNWLFVFISDAIKLLLKSSFQIFSYNFIGIQLALFFFLFLCISLLLFCGFNIYFSMISFFYFYLFIVCLFTFTPFSFWIFIHFSNSIFWYIGNLRAVLLTISFELCLWFSFIFIILFWSLYMFLLIIYLIFFFCCLSDWSRPPFDFVEGESELVWGFNTELGLISFLLLFFWEYILLFFFMCLFHSLTDFIFALISVLFIYSRALIVRAFFWWICSLYWIYYLFILTFYFFLLFNVFF